MSNNFRRVIKKFVLEVPIIGSLINKKRSNQRKQLRDLTDNYLETIRLAYESYLNGTSENKVATPIIEAFSTNNIDIRAIDNNVWILMLRSLSEDNDIRNTNIDKLLSVIKSLDHNLLSSTAWIHLYSLFLRLGFFHPAYYIRKLAVDVTLEKAKMHDASSSDLRKAILVAIEASDYDLADNYLTLRNKKHGVDYFSHAMYYLITLLKGQYKPTTNLWYTEKTNHINYADYIKGTKIAVVGPSETTSSDAKLIDSYERVVRMNYIKSGYCCDGIIKGLKTNISYFAYGSASRMVNSYQLFPDDIEWLVFKDTPDNKIINYHINRHKSLGSKVRKLQFHYGFCYNGTYNLLPLILLDLLQYFPEEIHIFHSNLYLTATKTKGYVYSDKTMDELKESHKRAFVRHDPLTQFYLLKRISVLGNIHGDKLFNQAISYSAEEYMRKLQEIYL